MLPPQVVSRIHQPDVRKGLGKVAELPCSKLWGGPVRVMPEGALEKPSAEILRSIAFGAAILAAGAVLYLFTR